MLVRFINLSTWFMIILAIVIGYIVAVNPAWDIITHPLFDYVFWTVASILIGYTLFVCWIISRLINHAIDEPLRELEEANK